MGVGWAFLPLGFVWFTPLLPLPAAYLGARDGWGSMLTLTIITGALLLVVLGPSAALLVFLLVGGLGGLLGLAQRRRWGLGSALGLATTVVLGAWGIWGAVLRLALGFSPTGFRAAIDRSIDDAAAFYQRLGLSAQSANAVSEQLHRLVEALPYLAPGLVGMGAVLLACVVLGLAQTAFARWGADRRFEFSLSRFRLPWPLAYVFIAGLALVVFARGEAWWQRAVLYAGIDLLLVAQTLFFVQGLALVHWWAGTRKVKTGARLGLYLAAVVGQVFFQLTGLLGLLDTWFDYRRRFAMRNAGSGPAR